MQINPTEPIVETKIEQKVEPKVEPTVTPVVEPQNIQIPDPKPDDLMQRVASFVDDNEPKVKVEDDFHFDASKISEIEDPKAREYAENAYKSLQKGFNQKFQEIADLRKAMESNQSQNQQWTVERVQSLINDPQFVQVAQQVAGQNPDGQSDDYSALSPTEKARIDKQEAQILALQNQLTSSQNQAQHEFLSTKYSDYKGQAVDTIKADMIAGKVNATNEHIYKAFNFDKAVNNAYALGRKDERMGIVEKSESASIDSQNTVQSDAPIKKEDNESSKSLWNRIAAKSIQLAAKTQEIRK